MKLPFFKVDAETKESYESRNMTLKWSDISDEIDKTEKADLLPNLQRRYLRADSIASIQPFEKLLWKNSKDKNYNSLIAMWDGKGLLCVETVEDLYQKFSKQAEGWEPESSLHRPTNEALARARLEKQAHLSAEEEARHREESLREEERKEERRLEDSLEEQSDY